MRGWDGVMWVKGFPADGMSMRHVILRRLAG
jgi:hypothetical protein